MNSHSQAKTISVWPRPAVQTLSDQVAKVVLSRIATGQLRPGDTLPSQRELSSTLGVGMSAVREGMQRLQALNVIDAEHGTGTRVKPLRWVPLIYDPSLFLMAVQHVGTQDLWETRQILEVQLMKLAALRATPANLSSVRTILDRAGDGPADFETSQDLNREFHIALARAAQNMVLEQLLDPLLSIQVEGASQYFNKARSRRTWALHKQIYEALAKKDPGAAQDAMLRHFEFRPAIIDEIEKASRLEKADAKVRRSGRRSRTPKQSKV